MTNVDEEVPLLVKAIERISGGGTEVTFGDLARDEDVTQTFEALLGTLKAARKRGVLKFQGELLLMGQHDSTVISLTTPGEESDSKAAAAPQAAAPPPPTQSTTELPMPAAEPAPASSPATVLAPSGPPTMQSDAASPANGEAAGTGKWAVDTSYINWRTADPNRLESRRSMAEVDPNTEPGQGLPTGSVAKNDDGKWQQVDVSYINHRTAEVERLEGRRSVFQDSAAATPSATVKKEGEKWKVDTSYIGYRTGDPNNIRKEGAKDGPDYADPAEVKHAYNDLKGGARPQDVDPTMKEKYLSDDEFQTVFGMSPTQFTGLPKWKQQNLKKAKDLF